MKPTTNGLFASQSSSFPFTRFRGQLPIIFSANQKKNLSSVVTLSIRSDSDVSSSEIACSRRTILVAPPLLAAAASLFLRPSISSAAAEEISSESVALPPPPETAPPLPVSVEKEEAITSRIYDATALGEPMAVGKDKKRVWEKLLNARIVYLGEAEQVPTRDDKVLELEIVRNLRKRCIESDRQISLALEAFPLDLQDQLNQYMDKRFVSATDFSCFSTYYFYSQIVYFWFNCSWFGCRMEGEALKSYVSHWPAQRWQEYEPLLSYCRDNAVKLIACGTPLKVVLQYYYVVMKYCLSLLMLQLGLIILALFYDSFRYYSLLF